MGRDEKPKPSESPPKTPQSPASHRQSYPPLRPLPPQTFALPAAGGSSRKDSNKKKKPFTTNPDHLQHVIKTNKGQKYRCPRARVNGKRCGALIAPTNHDISSHNSSKHREGSAYNKKQSTQDSNVIGCIPFCYAENGKDGPYNWGNFNNYLRHMRQVHGFTGHEAEIQERLVERARRRGDTSDPWYDRKVPERRGLTRKERETRKAAKANVTEAEEGGDEDADDDEDEDMPSDDELFVPENPARKPDDDFSGDGPAPGGAIPPIAVG